MKRRWPQPLRTLGYQRGAGQWDCQGVQAGKSSVWPRKWAIHFKTDYPEGGKDFKCDSVADELGHVLLDCAAVTSVSGQDFARLW